MLQHSSKCCQQQDAVGLQKTHGTAFNMAMKKCKLKKKGKGSLLLQACFEEYFYMWYLISCMILDYVDS